MAAATKLGKLPSWDLSALYSSRTSTKLKHDLHETLDRSKRFALNFKGRLPKQSGDMLAAAILDYESINEVLGRLGSYAYLVYAENISDAGGASFYQNISEKITDISTYLLFFSLELNKLDDKHLASRLRESTKLQKYEPWLRDIRTFRKYQLSDEVERTLHEKNISSRQSWHRLFEETLADMQFPFGKQQLSCAEILNKLSSKEAKTRKIAAKSIGETLGKHSKIFALVLNVLAKDKEIEDKWRGYPQPISSRNVSNFIEDEVTDALITTVQKNYKNISHRYYKLKAKWFDVKKLPYWDRNAPLPRAADTIIPWKKATDIVLSAYHDFSPAMAKVGKEFFDKNWIDAPARKGKDSGAFSHPTIPSAHPYILMNYQGKARDVMTLAHELGHGVHQVLSAKQGYLLADTPLTLAETASIFGEQLTFRKLLAEEKNGVKRKVLIAGKVEDMINTVIRQVAFCDFERQVHEGRRKGELSIEEICKIWMSVQSQSLGPAIKFDDEYKYYWAYISHFIHTPFYVYAYAFGECLVNSLYRVYENTPKGFEAKYIEMLKAGGTLHHRDLLAPFGLDASHPTFWQGGLEMISEFIDELEQ